MSVLNALLVIIVFFAILYGMYGMMVASIVKWSKKPRKTKSGKTVQPKLTAGELIKCYIPLYQVCYMREALYHTAMPFNIMAIISAVCIIWRILNITILPINAMVMFISVFVMWLGIILHLLTYSIATAAAIKLYGFSWFAIIMAFLFPYWVGFFFKSLIPNKMLALQKEDTFSAKNGDTLIKDKATRRA